MAAAFVLTEDEAVELLAFLVTAARTQVDEAAEHGPLRLSHAAATQPPAIRPRTPVTWQSLTSWERIPPPSAAE
jgi:hypothetical protein